MMIFATLDGTVVLRVPPGTRSGRTFRVKGRGVADEKGAGDYWVDLKQHSVTLSEEGHEHAEELIALESENTGKIKALTASEEIPPMVDQLRFFAGAARVLEVSVGYLVGEGLTPAQQRGLRELEKTRLHTPPIPDYAGKPVPRPPKKEP